MRERATASNYFSTGRAHATTDLDSPASRWDWDSFAAIESYLNVPRGDVIATALAERERGTYRCR